MPRPRSSRTKSAQPQRQHRLPLWLRRTIAAGVVVAVMGGLGVATGIGIMLARIPSVESLLATRPLGATMIYDREGKLVASLQNGENRKIVPLEEISEDAQHAVVASEDARFYHHWGVDPMGLARALTSFGQLGGGSTLTQQLAKNLFLSADRTAARKLADMWLAIQLERTLPKKKILEMYLNQVYFGHGAYGIETAAQKYFGKKASRLSIAESAMLSGLLPAPEYYSPYRNPEAAKERQRLVLRRMVESGYIDAETAAKEGERKLAYANSPDYAYRAPYFTSTVLQQLSERLGADLVMRGGLKIYTTMDLALQEAAEGIIKRGVAGYAKLNVGQGAMVAIEPGTGAVRVLVGGTSYDASQFNRATQARRQPGSTFKPFVYATAFADGYEPSTTIEDAPISFGAYSPQNYDHRFHGTVTFERALANSFNIPAVRVANTVGIERVIATAHAVGIRSELPPNLSVALGSAEVTPLELATAYATFAAEGRLVEPHLVTRVEDANGNLIDQFPVAPKQAIDESAVRKLNQCLAAVVNYGSGRAASIGRPAAGKTGTTSENRDTWFAGYTPDLAAVVWLGNDDNSRLSRSATGGGLAAPLWARFMSQAHRHLPIKSLPMPAYRSESPASGSGEVEGGASGAARTEATPTPPPVLEIGGDQPQEGQPITDPLPNQGALGGTPPPAEQKLVPAPDPRPVKPAEQPQAVPSIVIIQ